ncbi:prenyltransferase [Actinocrispum wychmicini]|uniref:Prenyltransferase/squalene oxidase-like repeat protein n=1 Tax=Actinocrispum wychmicini TaxID=1213861 RepID=A0A4R2J933_9PSEU|nr:prenyltransferase [Actinocrispum wychmicini]TCO53088.1 hypothetical protein EV192_111285 [Actinocrispum wychmicini]
MTAAWIAGVQRSDGAIPWYDDGPLDAWNHVEAAMGLDVAGRHAEAEAAYLWLAESQNPDGSWYSYPELAKDANFTAYAAVGVLHHALIADMSFLERLWPTIDAAMQFVLSLRRPDGAIRWRTGSSECLLAGNSSIHLALRCATDIASRLGRSRPEWVAAADGLRAVIVNRPEVFTPKPHSMDWYYPVLCSVVGENGLASKWETFVVPDLGVRCVHDQPWVTGGETAELALTLAVRGDKDRARQLLADIAFLRHTDGSYWTGYQFANQVIWPAERTTWTAGAMLLAAAAIDDEPATHTVFSQAAV